MGIPVPRFSLYSTCMIRKACRTESCQSLFLSWEQLAVGGDGGRGVRDGEMPKASTWKTEGLQEGAHVCSTHKEHYGRRR